MELKIWVCDRCRKRFEKQRSPLEEVGDDARREVSICTYCKAEHDLVLVKNHKALLDFWDMPTE